MKDVQYTHRFNKLLNDSLFQFATYGGRGKLADVLNHVQTCNAHKLRYWKLIKNVGGGVWVITPEGYDWLDGKVSVPERVVTYRGEVVRYDGPPMFRINVPTAIWRRSDYAQNAQRVQEEQPKLFEVR